MRRVTHTIYFVAWLGVFFFREIETGLSHNQNRTRTYGTTTTITGQRQNESLAKNCEVNRLRIKPEPRPWEGSTTFTVLTAPKFLVTQAVCTAGSLLEKKNTFALTAPEQEKGFFP